MKEAATIPRRAWLWVFAAYLFQAIPAAVRDEALPAALKNMGYSDTRSTQVVSVFGLIVALKILLAPLVSAFRPRSFILGTEAIIALLLIAVGMEIGSESLSIPSILCLLVMISLASAAHDFALDGYFVSALDDRGRATHSGLLSFSSKLGIVLAGPGLIWVAGRIMDYGPQSADAWSWAVITVAVIAFVSLAINAIGMSRESATEADGRTISQRFWEIKEAFVALLADRRLFAILGLIAFYRASEIHMAHILKPFSLSKTNGGLALDIQTYAEIRIPTVILATALGGIIGSQVISRLGLSRSLIPLGVAMHIPLATIAWLAANGSHNLWIIRTVFFIEHLAYGAGFCALILAMMKVASGPSAALRYAILSTFSLLAVYLPGLWAGYLSDKLGYAHYFLFALSLAIPGILSAWWAKRHFEEA
jgi:PAT family beta-lactamase induction signal transducer AmpG